MSPGGQRTKKAASVASSAEAAKFTSPGGVPRDAALQIKSVHASSRGPKETAPACR